MEPIVIALILLAAALAAIVLVVVFRPRKGVDDQVRYEALRSEINSTLLANQQIINSQLSDVAGQVAKQLSSMTMQLHAATGQMNTRMDSAARAVGEVREGLGELSKATEQIFEIGKDISGLQDLLRSPKLRGGLGELLLGEMLSQCLPNEHYSLQHTFSNGSRVDAVVRLAGGLVPIDSKFPLENFKKLIEARTDEEKKQAKKRFIGDCKRHIDSIASSYILPSEGTLNFAIMYIPAENVYYEAVIKDETELAAYAFSKRVVPASPNSLYAYLQTVLMGLRGMEVSRRAQEILAHLDALKNDFNRLTEDIDVLGRHLGNSRARHEELQRKAARFADRLDGHGQTTEAEEIPEPDKIS